MPVDWGWLHDKEGIWIPNESYKGTQYSPWALQACISIAVLIKFLNGQYTSLERTKHNSIWVKEN